MIMREECSKPNGEFSSDSCLSRCGGYSRRRYFDSECPGYIQTEEYSINVLELLVVMVCVKL